MMTPEEIETEKRRIEQAHATVKINGSLTMEDLAKRRATAVERQRVATLKHDLTRELAEVEAEECLAEIVERRGPLAACIVPTPAGPVVLERGADVTWKAFYAMATKKNVPPQDVLRESTRFVRECVAYPAKIDDLLSECPAALDPLASKLSELYGHRSGEDAPK